jgi:hypothetical protein
LFDEDGNPMTPTFSRGKSGKLYRYYVSAPLQQGSLLTGDAIRRLSARVIDRTVTDLAARLLPSHAQPLAQVRRVELHRGSVQLLVEPKVAARIDRAAGTDYEIMTDGDFARIVVQITIGQRGGATVYRGQFDQARPDRALIKALRKARVMVAKDMSGMPIVAAAPSSPYDRKLLRMAFLAPDIQRDILGGRQPHGFMLEQMIRMDIPHSWADQRRVLGWSAGQ